MKYYRLINSFGVIFELIFTLISIDEIYYNFLSFHFQLKKIGQHRHNVIFQG